LEAFHCTTAVLMKLLPFTVSVNAGPPAAAELGESEVTTPTGVLMKKFTELDEPPPGAGLDTVTDTTVDV
jgi:hypothetical protein